MGALRGADPAQAVNQRDQRALKRGVAVVAVAFFALRVLPSIVSWRAATITRVQQNGARLGDLREQLESLGKLEDSARKVKRDYVALAPKLLAGTSDAESAAEFTTYLTAAAEQSAVRVRRIVPLPDSAAVGSLRRVRLRAEVESDAAGIERLLHRLATMNPGIAVTSLQLTAADPFSAAAGVERLSVVINAVAWRGATQDSPGKLAE